MTEQSINHLRQRMIESRLEHLIPDKLPRA